MYPMSEPQKWVQKRTRETPKKAWRSGGIQKTKRRKNTVAKPRFSSDSLYLVKRFGILREIQSRAT